jgi:hypothetical protein
LAANRVSDRSLKPIFPSDSLLEAAPARYLFVHVDKLIPPVALHIVHQCAITW